MIAVEVPSESGYMICFAGVIPFRCALFLCWWDWLLLLPKSTYSEGSIACVCSHFLFYFILFIPLKLLICLIRGYSWYYWIFPLGVPVLHCESLKASRDGLPLFGIYCSGFNIFFPQRLLCDSIRQLSSIGLESNFIFPWISLAALPWTLTNANQCNYLWLSFYAFHFHSIHRTVFFNPQQLWVRYMR